MIFLTHTVAENSSASNANAANKLASSMSIPQPTAPTASGSGQAMGMPAPEPVKSPPVQLIRSMQSFKVLTECPIIVVLLFQLYPRFLNQNIPKFMPLIVSTLGLQAPISARNTHRTAYVDFIAAQVKVCNYSTIANRKTLSFLAYMLRGFADHLQPYRENIPKCVIQLLLNCPNESAATRKVVTYDYLLNTL